jgi:PAS domain-containing protein
MTDPLSDADAIGDLRRAKEALVGALAAMTKQEEQFRTTLSKIPTLVWLTTADGYAEFFSQGRYEHTGISMKDAQGAGWTGASHPDDFQAISTRWMKIWATTNHGLGATFRLTLSTDSRAPEEDGLR